MSLSWNSQKLPFIPGYTFRDVTKSAFHRPQTLDYKNGYAMPRRPCVGIGHDPLLSEQLIQQEIDELSFEKPDVTYDYSKQSLAEEFIPAYVALDKKVLRFHGFFKESIPDSLEEEYHVRPVVIYYYLEDDSMSIFEPPVENSGIPQGKRIKRQHLPKNEIGDHYLWKDLNLGMDLEAYGVKYHIVQCDNFTKDFMESEGIVLNDAEPMPVDPYIKHCLKPQQISPTKPSDFNMSHFLNMDRKVLRFFALWEESDSQVRETRQVTIFYFLVDDTVEIREVHKPNSGRDPFPVLVRRRKLPKKLKPDCDIFPSCAMELSKQEVDEYYSPKDFKVGEKMALLGRHFLLYDCDGYTKEYYQKNHPELEIKPIEFSEISQEKKTVFPPYNGFGSLEDSLRNCLSLIPKPPKKSSRKIDVAGNKVLCYRATMDSQNPVDEGRRFVLSYFLVDDKISIYEKPTRNSGIIGGKFLRKTRIPKPGSTVEDPVFYSPADLAIGATVEVFSNRFVLTDADHFVLKYLESIASEVPEQTLDSLRKKLGERTADNQAAASKGDAVEEPSA